ncbi:MAG: N-acetyltransferase family protein [Acetobacteraceae bacterium]
MTAVPTPRDATPDDVGHIRRLIHGLAVYEKMEHKFVASESDLHTALFGPNPRAHAILLEPSGNPPVGVAVFYYTFNTFSCRPNIFLEDLFVEPAHRGKGYGLALLRALARRAVAENCVRIDWHVLQWNAPSIAFYAAIGATQMTDWQVRQLQGEALLALAQGDQHG